MSRRKLFSAILTFVVLLAFLGFVINTRAFFPVFPGADEEDPSWYYNAPVADTFVSSNGMEPGPESTAGSGEGRVVTTQAATAARNGIISASSLKTETEGRPHTENTTPLPKNRKNFKDARNIYDVKILKIQAPPKCGASGFKVEIDTEAAQMPDWAEGSVPFPSELNLTDPEPTAHYFAQVTSDLQCYKKGTDLIATMTALNVSQCSCLPGYHGEECGIPSPVWFSPDFKEWILPYLSVRSTVRRIIQAIPVNHELDLTNIRAHELGNAVTATLLAEADFTAAGELKDRFLERKAREDPSFLGPYRSRTILLRANTFPPEGCTDGWVADRFSRSFIGKEGLSRLHGLQDDDFFLLFDADEIPRRDVLDFLRFYEGYREPIAFRLRWYVYGFFWESLGKKAGEVAATRIEAGCSVRMLRQVYEGDPYSIRREEWLEEAIEKARVYELAMRRRLRTFEIGTAEHPGGYHCSWCFHDFEGLQIKLVSSQLSDGPRWGSLQDRLDPDYLRRVVRDGEWFDGTMNFAPLNFSEEFNKSAVTLKDFAPSYMLRHFDKYSYFLVNPSERENQTLMKYYREAIGRTFPDSIDEGFR